jgi:hypothetical protein
MNPTRFIPPRTLLLLSVGVLLAHFVLLRDVSHMTLVSTRTSSIPFETRLLRAPDHIIPKPVLRRPAPAKPVAPPSPLPEAAPTEAISAAPELTPASAITSEESVVAEAVAAIEQAPAAPSPPPIALPPPRKLFYDLFGKVSGFSYSVNGELLWQHDEKSYSARAVVSAFLLGSRTQTSVGTLTAQGLVPTRFGDKVRSEVAAHFEWDKGVIIFSANTNQPALLAGAQDHLSLFFQLASLLAGDPARYTAGSLIEVQAVGPRDAEIWQIEVGEEEILSLPGGELSAIKLHRVAQKTFDVTVELWLAPKLDYLPARIRLSQNNGDFIDQQWKRSETP